MQPKTLKWIIRILIFLALLWLAIGRLAAPVSASVHRDPPGGNSAVHSAVPAPAVELDVFRLRMLEDVERAEEDLRRIAVDFQREMEELETFPLYIYWVHKSAREAGQSMHAFLDIGKLLTLKVKDLARGGEKAEAYLMEQILPPMSGWTAAYQQQVQFRVDRLAREILFSGDVLRDGLRDTLLEMKDHGAGNPEIYPLPDMEDALRNLQTSAVISMAGIGFDLSDAVRVAMWAKVRLASKKILVPAATKITAKTAAGASAAAIDGPLPAGDIFGAILLLWSVKELFDMRTDFVAEIELGTREHLLEIRAAEHERAYEEAISRLNATQTALADLRRTLERDASASIMLSRR